MKIVNNYETALHHKKREKQENMFILILWC